MKQKMKQFMGILFSIMMVLNLLPGMSLTAFADNSYEGFFNTTKVVKFDGKDWYLIDYDSSTVTLLAKECVAAAEYNSSGSYECGIYVEYNNSTVKAVVDNYYTNSISADAKAAVNGSGMFLLTIEQADHLSKDVMKCSQYDGADFWWLCSPGSDDDEEEEWRGRLAAAVNCTYGYICMHSSVNNTFGVRPALKLNLSSVIFSSESNSFIVHTHSFTYSTNGATITATCTADGCTPTDNKATLTIVAPTLTTYGGTGDATATLTGLSDFNTATRLTVAETNIKYVGRDGTEYAESTTAPTSVGKYTAKITLSGVKTSAGDNQSATASVDYEISQPSNPSQPGGNGGNSGGSSSEAPAGKTNPYAEYGLDDKYVPEGYVDNSGSPMIIEGKNLSWNESKGKAYWYENGIKQGTYYDSKGVLGDGTIRGREIYDKESDGWYWLDSCYDGAKAVGKEVWVPYVYQNESTWSDEDVQRIAYESDEGMGECVLNAMRSKSGKWVRYDENGRMLKGWVVIKDALAEIYPDQAGNIYYYDSRTGLLAKGSVTLSGQEYYFNETTGVLERGMVWIGGEFYFK